ncbi:MAG: hydroxyacid dehydrogenase [Rhodospirillales bacterium]|jgi:D-3-phosphoglycerate dehydrogenase|nr:hydroxyacid dehydrogenase [Rhodospirillales bacterium]
MATNRKLVLVPHTMGRAGTDLLSAREDIEMKVYPADITQAALLPLLAEAAGIALSGTPYRQKELDASPTIEVVARIGVGFDAVEVPALTARRVPLMTAGTSNSTSVAEHALYFIMALAKRGPAMDGLVRGGRWRDRHDALPAELAGKTVLIVGFGRIGTRSARRCAAMEMTVLVHDPYVSPDAIRAAGYEPVSDLDTDLGRADFVSIHCPKNAETVGMFNAARLARMKHGAALVNTARGGIVDEPALAAAIRSGHVSGAGLDVLAEEPTPLDNPLLALPQVITSPHMAGVTTESVAGMARTTAENILSVLDGHPIRAHAVNPEVFD